MFYACEQDVGFSFNNGYGGFRDVETKVVDGKLFSNEQCVFLAIEWSNKNRKSNFFLVVISNKF